MTNPAEWAHREQFRNPELQKIHDALLLLPGQLRQGLVDELWQKIPAYVSEFSYSANLGVGVPLYVAPQYTTLEIIRSVVAVVPAGATGLVQLGGLTLPVSPGLTSIGGIVHPMNNSDIRCLTIATTAGPAALWVSGDQAPTFGTMGP